MHAVLRDLERAAAAEARARAAESPAVKRPGGRLGGYAEEVAAAMRRRKEVRRPRVRVRVEHGEARLLDDGLARGRAAARARARADRRAARTEEGRADAG